MQYTFETVGIVHSCYKDKFAIPRQSGLVTASTASIELLPPYNDIEITRGLEDFSHLWLGFIFHKHVDKGWNTTVKPPRLDGRQRFGVFATRASFRPNPLGLSLVELDSIKQNNGKLFIHVKGADLMDQTPVIDIKPYVPYSDSIPDAKGGFTDHINEQKLHIFYSHEAENDCQIADKKFPQIKEFISQLLALDHRAYYYKKIDKIYSTKVYDFDLKWRINDSEVKVISLKPY
ncbi:MAG: tRNA (N6-threonylcarbamoyladenosine(37)-N6)-methyltransferase TrmO [gamma proteobacterium symbiont of Bathyaustriella thionipta]|nr:tRNA (N6-threonylcarbamoyladenosine(37)-N6)-methyltransferase TrmO [gamma proteobacterium symbiont of Bathyaustriella thionipta]MCU7949946.1 tRNA (N6-threonylcarbamoyladenosine(37)-N6)-methyltransferase TrmO [gamma proteobacterium symbiont of Bathyaustriella thionipta]MCU7952643.1 tRNA (N6-threonylcarbamoyladenosine(37)-N6)-methyltransferase TrmO [gamma proteobacterium symbiont of Bathyaustriella thionipta]MCU7955861.1 tRNA (N6-threonylcarbamoyladenosine(37)-N6)-methyltransferase TrmO [gamma 